MKNQEALNAVWDYFLVKKRKPGVNPVNNECLLITATGSRCAIGCLPLYMEDKEAAAIALALFKEEPDMSIAYGCGRVGVNVDFGRELQATHDSSSSQSQGDIDVFRERLKQQLIELSSAWGIAPPEGE
jgi:hypothetical protein